MRGFVLDMIGKKYGRLTVVSVVEGHIAGRRGYVCRCDCGQERNVQGKLLRNGSVRICGCLVGDAGGKGG